LTAPSAHLAIPRTLGLGIEPMRAFIPLSLCLTCSCATSPPRTLPEQCRPPVAAEHRPACRDVEREVLLDQIRHENARQNALLAGLLGVVVMVSLAGGAVAIYSATRN